MVLSGVPRTKKLLDWSKWKNLIDFQKNIFSENNIAEKLQPPYLNNWTIDLIVRPNKIQNFFTFKNLKKNEFKPFILKELEKIEEEPIPKWLKTYFDDMWEMNLEAEFDAELFNYYDDTYAFQDGEIKAYYLSKKGIWITNAKDGNPIPIEQKYQNLWEEAKSKIADKHRAKLRENYLKENNIEYDKKKQAYFQKELNPDWPYKALYIDTINYNYWERLQEQLENLRSYYESLPDETPKSNAEDPKKEDGKKYEPWCDKFYPLDYSKVFGIPITIPPPLMFVTADLTEINKVLNKVNNEVYR